MKIRFTDILLLAGLACCASALRAETGLAPDQIQIAIGKTYLIDTAANIERVSVAAPGIAEAVPVNPRSLMVNGKAAGETSLIVWLGDGTRHLYDVVVKIGESRLEAANKQAAAEFDGKILITEEQGTVYLNGVAKDLFASRRAVAIAETLGQVVNLLNIEVPPQETQILLKVRFADVDRSKALDLGINFAGAPKGFPFSATTGTYSPSRVTSIDNTKGTTATTISFSDALNLLFFDPHLDIGATLKDLQTRAVLQILAEPNVLAMNGHEASFVAGGEFPFPTLQGGGSGVGQITVSFREFGVRIHFLPTITPRGTIRLHVVPEVSSLDYANALSVQGYTIPGLNTRRIETDVELKDGQSFAIAGLLDQRTTEQLSRIPGLADIPLFGKLFTTKSVNKSNSELLVIVTPQLVAPIPDAATMPDLERPLKFMEGTGILNTPPQTPGPEKTGQPSVKPTRERISVQEMEKIDQGTQNQTAAPPAAQGFAPLGASGGGGAGGGGAQGGQDQAGSSGTSAATGAPAKTTR